MASGQSRRLLLSPRTTYTSGQVVSMAGFVMPAAAGLRVDLDMPGSDQIDPTKTVTVDVEVSTDGVVWVRRYGFTTVGRAGQIAEPGYPELTASAYSFTPPPPPGHQVRVTLRTGATSVTTGFGVTPG